MRGYNKATFCLLLSLTTTTAIAANRFANNTVIATGTAGAIGTTTTIDLTAASFSGSFVEVDAVFAGIVTTGGTGADARTVAHKITAINGLHVATVTPAFANASAANWTYIITYGSDVNTSLSQTKSSGTTGPSLSLYQVLYTACSTGDVLNVCASGATYDGLNDAGMANFATIDIHRAGVNITYQGYTTTVGDLATSGTRVTDSVAANFPLIQSSTGNQTILTDPGVASATSITFKNLRVASGITPLYVVNAASPAVTITWQECKIGSTAQDSDTITYYDSSASGVTKSHVFLDSLLYSESTLLYLVNGKFSATDCNFTGDLSNLSNYYGIFISTENSNTVQIMRAEIVDSSFNINGGNSVSNCILRTFGLSQTNLFRIANCTAEYTLEGGQFLLAADSLHNVLIENCTFNCNTITSANQIIALGQDTSAVTTPSHSRASVITSAAQGAAGTGNATAGASTLVLATGSSATDNFYSGAYIRLPTTLQVHKIDSYVGATRTATIWGIWVSNATAPEYSIVRFDRIPNNIVIRNNTFRFTGDDSHAILVGPGSNGATIYGNTVYDADNAFVIKGEGCYVAYNYAYSGNPFILKGANNCFVDHNTFVCNSESGFTQPAFQLRDMSPKSDNLEGADYSKCSGHIVTNNIISVDNGIAVLCLWTDNTGSGSWTDLFDEDNDANFYDGVVGPGRQPNYFNNNLYYRGDGGDIAQLDGTTCANLAALKAKWANVESDGWTFNRMFPLNDAASISANPLLVDPANGDFRTSSGSPARRAATDGTDIGASQHYTVGGGGGSGGGGYY